MTSNEQRVKVLLSIQRALLGAISPEMRAIDVSWNDSEIRLRFTVDANEDNDIDELVNAIEGEIEGDFLPDAKVSSEVIVVPDGIPVSVFNFFDQGYARVYARHEGDLKLL
ncbi:hypothetical protein [uncultured Gimesia sp.]|uniref:hypothetical protein n=1 Tax=uncultured Gimesia sp. TaxID=1678688 RepID=UPI002630FFF5|nr:hypothetical protein [uncultured Gimesia sp.]